MNKEQSEALDRILDFVVSSMTQKIKMIPTKIKCPKCKYSWKTKAKMWWITCPNCRNKIKNEKENLQT